MKIFFSVFFVVAMNLVVSFGTANAQTSAAASFKVTTIYLVRHAERSNEPPTDPVLSEAGKMRAPDMIEPIISHGGLPANERPRNRAC